MTQNASAMLDALAADGPAPEFAAELRTFGQFVGSWELNCTEYERDRSSRTLRGEWHFGWVLNGRAVQDVWILPSRDERARLGIEPVEWGTAVRFYDPAIGAWRVNWSGLRDHRRPLSLDQRDHVAGRGLDPAAGDGRAPGSAITR